MAYIYKDNAELIKDLQKGNEAAYTYLVNTFHKPLFIYALNLCNDHDLAEDIAQDVFIKTWEFRLRLKTERKIKNFLYKIAYNEFINLYHRKQITSELNKIYIEALNEAVDDSQTALLNQKITILNRGIEALPNKCKEVFLLSKKDGLTNVEISEYLNISMKTVEGHISRAYIILREELGRKLKAILFLLFGRAKTSKF